ncbi:MAG: SRPBCC family protein [Candidatus Melainabacteria bacterium]|nr:SRPBCC family protein [Candidatus Melainabacteria bacterium]
MKKSIEVNATPEAVFNAIISYRSSDPESRTVRSAGDGRATIEEKFGGVPIIGHSMITYEEVEVPFERIDYTLVKGDKLAKFEGAWVLTASPDGQSTTVELTADLDIAIAFPFKDQILNAQADQDMQRRLTYIKEFAENA